MSEKYRQPYRRQDNFRVIRSAKKELYREEVGGEGTEHDQTTEHEKRRKPPVVETPKPEQIAQTAKKIGEIYNSVGAFNEVDARKIFATIPPFLLDLPEIQKVAADIVAEKLRKHNSLYEGVMSFVNIIRLPSTIIEPIVLSPDVQKQARLAVSRILPQGVSTAISMATFFHIPDTELAQLAEERCKKILGTGSFSVSGGKVGEVYECVEKLQLSEDSRLEIAKAGIKTCFEDRRADSIQSEIAKSIIDTFHIEDILQDAEIKMRVKESLIYNLQKHNFLSASKIVENLNASSMFVEDESLQNIAYEAMQKSLESGNVYAGDDYRKLGIAAERFFPMATKVVVKTFAKSSDDAVRLAQKLKIPSSYLCTPAMQALAVGALVEVFKKNKEMMMLNNGLLSIKELFDVPDELLNTPEIHNMVQQWVLQLIRGHYIRVDYIEGVRKVFPVPDSIFQLPEIQTRARENILHDLKCGFIPSIKEAVGVPDAILQDPEVQEAAKQGMARLLSDCLNQGEDFQFTKDRADQVSRFISIPIEAGVYTAIENELLKQHTDRAVALANTFKVPFEFKSYLESSLNDGKWATAAALGTMVPECSEMYTAFVAEQKRIACSRDAAEQRNKAVEILAGLAQNGDQGIAQEFTTIIFQRGQQTEIPADETGFDSVQEAAFLILRRLDNPEANRVLFNLLLNENIPTTAKQSTFTALTHEGRNFLNFEARTALKSWSELQNQHFDWQDLQYIAGIDNIPSTDLRARAKKYIGQGVSSFLHDTQQKPGIHDWASQHAQIPTEHVLMLAAFKGAINDSDRLDEKMANLYTTIRKENSKREAILAGLISVLETAPGIQILLCEKLQVLEFGQSKEDADRLAAICKSIKFINDIEKITAQRPQGEDYWADDEVQIETKTEIESEIKELFERASSLAELQENFEKFAVKKIQTVLPHPEITQVKVQAVQEAWNDNLEPIFTYLSRYPELKEYIAEMVVHMDTAEAWQAWRYNKDNEATVKQIGHLSEEQLGVWKNNSAAELGEVLLAQSSVDKPSRIRSLLTTAIHNDRHIYNPEAGFTKHQFIQETLGKVYAEAAVQPNDTEKIYSKALTELTEDAEQVDVVLQAAAGVKVKQTLERNFALGSAIKFNSQTAGAVRDLMGWLPSDLGKKLLDNYKQGEADNKQQQPEQDKKVQLVEEIFEPAMRAVVLARIEEAEQSLQSLLTDAKVFEKHGLDKENVKNLSPYYTKRQELKVTMDLLRLSTLSNKLIATNRIAEFGGKRGETLTTVLENLKKFFKDSSLLQDIKNIEVALAEEQKFGEKRRLVMIATDNPQLVWQVGKYPLGNGSCQHYSEGSMAQSLLGYVGDAHSRAVYLLDVNTLTKQYQEVIQTEGVADALTKHIPAQDLLTSTVARTLIKLTKEGTIFLEPTYSVVNKGDNSMDTYFNAFVNLFYAEPMNVTMARGLGETQLHIPASRNPSGQYEDGAEGDANNAGMGIQKESYSIATKIINQNYVASPEESAVIEQMRMSVGQ